MIYSILLSDAVGAIYRKGIFQKLDQKHDVDFLFGISKSTVKSLASSDLKKIIRKPTIQIFGNWYWQSGIFSQVFFKKKDAYILDGELYSLSNWAILSLNFLFFRPKKIILWSHGWYGRESLAKRILKRIYFGIASRTLFYGNYAREQMHIAGGNIKNISVIHNSLDYKVQINLRERALYTNLINNYFNNNHHTIIFIGRLNKQKKLHYILSAVNILREKGLNLNILFVGCGEDEKRLQDMSQNYKLNTWFYGASYDEEINAQLVAQSDICVSPGNVGLTAIHSMMFGTPVITHNNFHNQNPEFEAIKPGITGDFFKENDVNSLADTIYSWILKHSNRDEIRQACYKEIDENWNPDFQLKVIEKVISQ